MSNKTLLEILVDELPWFGGWPNDADRIVQDEDGQAKSVDINAGVTYRSSTGIWFRHSGNTIFCEYLSKSTDRATAIITREMYEQALAEKSHKLQFDEMTSENRQPWNGEGLPLVGTVCEALYSESGMTYLKTKVFGVNEHGQPIHRWEEGPRKFEYQASPLTSVLSNPVFRPIRTPEQIEAERRERVTEKMKKYIEQRMMFSSFPTNAKKLAERFYDDVSAGKIKGVKIDE